MKTNIAPGKIYRSSIDIKILPIFVTKVEPNAITYYYMREPYKLYTINVHSANMFWSEIQ